ncbi:hypothetical protein EGR_10703 [Echinococcus granulosus]|uniref:Uncharacterized protein n=1 Tax=Echinococcus granulosus TaxID=6210 RepID=W6U049_ECHGR|nr:hypothetical protein EGR_10703 [Echinococcus granulosus]EUB54440.1 hypothetical protein EGR_10703 [Echinococcus granulosus]
MNDCKLLSADVPDSPLSKGSSKVKRFCSPASPVTKTAGWDRLLQNLAKLPTASTSKRGTSNAISAETWQSFAAHQSSKHTHEHPDVIQLCSQTNKNVFRKIVSFTYFAKLSPLFTDIWPKSTCDENTGYLPPHSSTLLLTMCATALGLWKGKVPQNGLEKMDNEILFDNLLLLICTFK